MRLMPRAVTPFRYRPAMAPRVVLGHGASGTAVSMAPFVSLAAAAASETGGYRGLVCFSYPLHRPGVPELGPRVAHWPSIPCPVLLLSGESDPFARIELLRAAVPLLRHGELVTYPRLGHGLKPVLDDALDRTAAFIRALPA